MIAWCEAPLRTDLGTWSHVHVLQDVVCNSTLNEHMCRRQQCGQVAAPALSGGVRGRALADARSALGAIGRCVPTAGAGAPGGGGAPGPGDAGRPGDLSLAQQKEVSRCLPATDCAVLRKCLLWPNHREPNMSSVAMVLPPRRAKSGEGT